MTDVTVFFRDISKWKSPDSEYKNATHEFSEIISDRDVTNLYDLSVCILHIRKRAKDEGKKTTYDNPTLEEFIDDFTLMIDDISRKKNIRDYIGHRPGPTLEISVPVKYQ